MLLGLVMLQPPDLVSDVTIGLAFVPVVGASRWLSPLAIGLVVLLVVLLARSLTAEHPLVDLRRWRDVARRTDLLGAGLLALALSGVILAFATADPEVPCSPPPAPGGWPGRRPPRRCSCGATGPGRSRWSPTVRCGPPRPGARWWSASSSARR